MNIHLEHFKALYVLTYQFGLESSYSKLLISLVLCIIEQQY